MKVWDGPTAKMRPGQGHSSSPRPPSNSTVTDNHVRAIPRGWHAAPDTTAGPTRCSVAVSGRLLRAPHDGPPSDMRFSTHPASGKTTQPLPRTNRRGVSFHDRDV